jgi:hypothetical protein
LNKSSTIRLVRLFRSRLGGLRRFAGAGIEKGLASLEPADADASLVADAIVNVVGTPFGKQPFRVRIDPSDARAEMF